MQCVCICTTPLPREWPRAAWAHEGDSGLAAAGLRRTVMVSGAEGSAPASAEPASRGGACGSTGVLISPKL